jgi:hypothetical protein
MWLQKISSYTENKNYIIRKRLNDTFYVDNIFFRTHAYEFTMEPTARIVK